MRHAAVTCTLVLAAALPAATPAGAPVLVELAGRQQLLSAPYAIAAGVSKDLRVTGTANSHSSDYGLASFEDSGKKGVTIGSNGTNAYIRARQAGGGVIPLEVGD